MFLLVNERFPLYYFYKGRHELSDEDFVDVDMAEGDEPHHKLDYQDVYSLGAQDEQIRQSILAIRTPLPAQSFLQQQDVCYVLDDEIAVRRARRVGYIGFDVGQVRTDRVYALLVFGKVQKILEVPLDVETFQHCIELRQRW